MIFDVTQRGCGLKLGALTQYLTIEGNKATVKHGKLGERFSIVCCDEKYSVIHIDGSGVAFTGDFPHFGVRNVDENDTMLNSVMNKLFVKLNRVKDKDPNKQTKFINILQKTEKLDELCRLFVKVMPNDSKFKLYHLDAVGTITKETVDNGSYDFP